MTTDERAVLFLDELAELTKKYRVKICGCGCCDSPYLVNLDKNEDNDTELDYGCICWNEEDNEYGFNISSFDDKAIRNRIRREANEKTN